MSKRAQGHPKLEITNATRIEDLLRLWPPEPDEPGLKGGRNPTWGWSAIKEWTG